MVYLELLKQEKELFYDDDLEFYLPQDDEIILCKPFADERKVFKKLESLEAFIFTYSIRKITVVTMNKEGSLSTPFQK